MSKSKSRVSKKKNRKRPHIKSRKSRSKQKKTRGKSRKFRQTENLNEMLKSPINEKPPKKLTEEQKKQNRLELKKNAFELGNKVYNFKLAEAKFPTSWFPTNDERKALEYKSGIKKKAMSLLESIMNSNLNELNSQDYIDTDISDDDLQNHFKEFYDQYPGLNYKEFLDEYEKSFLNHQTKLFKNRVKKAAIEKAKKAIPENIDKHLRVKKDTREIKHLKMGPSTTEKKARRSMWTS